MTSDSEFQEFSEKAAVAYIRARLSKKVSDSLSDSDLLDIIDLSYDYYDKKGFLDFSDVESDVDEREMAEFVATEYGDELTADDALEIIRLENEYEDSLNDF